MRKTDAPRDGEDATVTGDDRADRTDGAVSIEIETGVLVHEPDNPDAWIRAEFECAVED